MPSPAPSGWTILSLSISGSAQAMTAYFQFKKVSTGTTYPTALMRVGAELGVVDCGASFLLQGTPPPTWPVNIDTYGIRLATANGLIGPLAASLTFLVQGIQTDDVFSVMIATSTSSQGTTNGVTVVVQENVGGTNETVLREDLSPVGTNIWVDFLLPLT